MGNRHVNAAWQALRIGLGLMAVLAGLDKFFDRLTTWTMYVSPLAERWSPLAPETLMAVVGVVEITVGLAILTRWTRAGAWVAMAWLAAIAINLVTMGMFYDLAVRDLELAVAAFALAQLSAARESPASGAGATAAFR